MTEQFCIYCANRRNCKQFSIEHVWPQSLGGGACPVAWHIPNVCKRCNEIAGQWVDAGFQKNWFISNEIALASRCFMDPLRPGAAPFIWMGFDQEIPTLPDQVCERWAGQAGEHLYHIRQKDESKWFAMAGGDFIKNPSTSDRAFLILAAGRTEYWHLTALRSFAEFSSPNKRCLTVLQMPGRIPFKQRHEPPFLDNEDAEIAWIRSRPIDEKRLGRLSFDLDFADRFLAKLALGFTCCILGLDATKTGYADQLRNILWKQPHDGSIMPTNFFNSTSTIDTPLSDWHAEGCWTIAFCTQPDGFYLFVITPGARFLSIRMAEDARFWRDEIGQKYSLAKLTIVSPQRNIAAGPFDFPDLLAHKNGHKINAELRRLDSLRIDQNALPAMT